MSGLDYVLVCAAAFAAGLVNALAGGGTLITFPVLTAVGVPPVAANVTNTVALCPGFIGSVMAQRRDFEGQRGRLIRLLPAGVIGGVAGGLILLSTSEQAFRAIVPFLILAAAGLLAAQDRLRDWLLRSASGSGRRAGHEAWAVVIIGLAAVYGGYFGAGLGVIMLAVMGLLIDDTLTRINAVKSALALVINVAAAIFFAFSGQVLWTVALVMALGAIAGGSIGGRLASRVSAPVLRRIVIAIAVLAAVGYWIS